jgi:fumarate hydratase class II
MRRGSNSGGLNAKRGFAEAFAAKIAAFTALTFLSAPNNSRRMLAPDD